MTNKGLKIEEKSVREVDYHDLDKFISDEFGIQYECVPYEEWNNYSSHSIDVKPKPLGDHEKAKISRGDFRYLTGDLLNELCHQGKLEAGEYLINIFW
jgi:hypothetical protein